jgi:L-rhamnose-H+ transport protein
MNLSLSFILILLAGLINGSFALPTKYVKGWKFENIWLEYAIWAFLLFPWIAIAIYAPQVLQVYRSVPAHLTWIMIIGGFLFGVGQVGFALAIDSIGIGLTFVICLGLGTGLGFFIPLVVQHPEKMMTLFGFVTLTGTALAILGFIFSTYAGKLRDDHRGGLVQHDTKRSPHVYLGGVLLAIMAGLFSAGQNFCFSFTDSMQTMALSLGASKLGASIIVWPGFLTFTFMPYAAYMIYLFSKNRSFGCYNTKGTSRYFIFAFIMGLFWFGSLMFYSKASQLIGSLGPVIGFPMFMVVIILASNFWGWIHKEWSHAGRAAWINLGLGLILLIAAVIVLGYSSRLI